MVNVEERQEMWNLSRKRWWERILEMTSSDWKQREKTVSLLKNKCFLVIWWGPEKLGAKNRVFQEVLPLNCGGRSLRFWGTARRKIARCIGGSCTGESPQILKDKVAIWSLREVGLHKPHLIVMLCQAVCPVSLLLQEKNHLKTVAWNRTFIISHSFCGSESRRQVSWLVQALDVSCSCGLSAPVGAGIGRGGGSLLEQPGADQHLFLFR